jgi:hypothetical protein
MTVLENGRSDKVPGRTTEIQGRKRARRGANVPRRTIDDRAVGERRRARRKFSLVA